MSGKENKVPIHQIKTKEMNARGFAIIDLSIKGEKGYDSSVLHRHTFFELFLFTNSQGRHEIDFRNYPIEKNTVHFVSPGQIHRVILQDTKGYAVCFTEDFIALKTEEDLTTTFPFYEPEGPSFLQLDKNLASEIGNLIRSGEREYAAGHNAELLRSYLNLILFKIKARFLEDAPVMTGSDQQKKMKVTLFKKLINDHFISHEPLSFYAERLNISPNHLNAICKKHGGRTASELVNERLLLECKRLLYATDLSIKEISFQLGFADVPYFNRFFKKRAGKTPLAYREQVRKDR